MFDWLKSENIYILGFVGDIKGLKSFPYMWEFENILGTFVI